MVMSYYWYFLSDQWTPLISPPSICLFSVGISQFSNSVEKQILGFFKKDFIYLFLEKGEGKEEERERDINAWLPLLHPLLRTWPTTQACTLTGNRTSDPLVHKPGLNPLSHTSQGRSWFYKGPMNSSSPASPTQGSSNRDSHPAITFLS